MHVEDITQKPNSTWPKDVRTKIRIYLHSPLFRDLFLTLYYKAASARGPLSQAKAELGEVGWGVPGLVSEDTRIKLDIAGSQVLFDIECSIELRADSDKGGLKIPLPFPRHRGLVTGWYDFQNSTCFARFHEFGDD